MAKQEDLSKRGKVGDVYRSGSYKKAARRGFKTAGLTSKEMGKATTLRGKKLTAKQRTRASELKDISQTRWEKGRGVVDKSGKAFTGTVMLASGKTASYVKGRRVGIGPKKKAPSGGGGGGGGMGGGTRGAGMSSANAERLRQVKNAERAAGGKTRTAGSLPSNAERARNVRNQERTSNRPMATQARINPRATSFNGQVTARRVPARNYTSEPKNPNIGDTWTQKYPNGKTIKRVYTAGGWRVAR